MWTLRMEAGGCVAVTSLWRGRGGGLWDWAAVQLLLLLLLLPRARLERGALRPLARIR